MTDINRNKFWFAIGRCSAFTEADHRVFKVWPTSDIWTKNKSVDLNNKYLVGYSLEDARQQAHFFIDKMFKEYAKADENCTIKQAPPPPDSSPISGLNELVIEPEKPSTPATPQKISNADLLDLKELL